MKCRKTEELLIPFIYNELSQDEGLKISRHITACGNCAKQLERLWQLFDKWENPDYLLLTDDFSKKVINSLPEKRTKSSLSQNRKLETIFNFAVAYVVAYLFFYTGTFHKLPDMADRFTSIIIEKENEFILNSLYGISWFDKFYFQVLQFFQ